MLSPWLFTAIVVALGFLLYKYGYYRGVMDAKELREQIEKIQNG